MTQSSVTDRPFSTFFEQQVKDSLFHSQLWLDLVTKLYGYTKIILTTTDGKGQITGVLPLCFLQSPLTGARLVSIPFSDHCPLFAVDETSANGLIDQAIRIAHEKRAKYLELRTGNNDVLAKRPDLKEGNLYVSWHMPLTADLEAIWSGLRKPIQRQIRKSEKLGVKIRFAVEKEDMAQYYRLHLSTRTNKYGMPSQPQRFFSDLWDAFAGYGGMQLLLAEYQGSVIAGMVLLAAGTTIKYAYGASDEDFLNLAPNNLLFWTAISWACTHGYQTLDLGRTARDNEGLMEYKRRWGAIEKPLPYYYYPHMVGLSATSESDWKFRLLTSCWKRLPLPLAGSLGGYLYKHLG